MRREYMEGTAATDVYVRAVSTKDDMSRHEGEYYDIDTGDWRVIGPDAKNTRVWALEADDDAPRLLCYFLSQAIAPALCTTAVECFRKAGEQLSTNRGAAAGMISGRRERNRVGKFERGVPANTAIVGYIDSTKHDLPCRLTAFTKSHWDDYRRGTPFIRAIDECFRKTIPDAYERQRIQAHKTAWNIEGTSFSTMTVNLNFRTALHRDSGDFQDGFGNLVVCSSGVEGGHLLFPRFRVAVQLTTGDFLAMDVHEWHCNSAISLMHNQTAYRLSFVCYLRQRMHRCDELNRRLDVLRKERVGMDAESLCDRIYQTIGIAVMPEKETIGTGPTGLQWWIRRHPQLSVQYKGKRYTVYDHQTGKTVYNLLPALEYVAQQYASSTTRSDGG